MEESNKKSQKCVMEESDKKHHRNVRRKNLKKSVTEICDGGT
jgi:hypothetical protein